MKTVYILSARHGVKDDAHLAEQQRIDEICAGLTAIIATEQNATSYFADATREIDAPFIQAVIESIEQTVRDNVQPSAQGAYTSATSQPDIDSALRTNEILQTYAAWAGQNWSIIKELTNIRLAGTPITVKATEVEYCAERATLAKERLDDVQRLPSNERRGQYKRFARVFLEAVLSKQLVFRPMNSIRLGRYVLQQDLWLAARDKHIHHNILQYGDKKNILRVGSMHELQNLRADTSLKTYRVDINRYDFAKPAGPKLVENNVVWGTMPVSLQSRMELYLRAKQLRSDIVYQK